MHARNGKCLRRRKDEFHLSKFQSIYCLKRLGNKEENSAKAGKPSYIYVKQENHVGFFFVSFTGKTLEL